MWTPLTPMLQGLSGGQGSPCWHLCLSLSHSVLVGHILYHSADLKRPMADTTNWVLTTCLICEKWPSPTFSPPVLSNFMGVEWFHLILHRNWDLKGRLLFKITQPSKAGLTIVLSYSCAQNRLYLPPSEALYSICHDCFARNFHNRSFRGTEKLGVQESGRERWQGLFPWVCKCIIVCSCWRGHWLLKSGAVK